MTHVVGPILSRACRSQNSCWRGPLRLHHGNRCSGFRWQAWYWRCWARCRSASTVWVACPNACDAPTWGVMALHAAILALALRALHLYDMAWTSVAKLSPAACLVELGEQGRLPLAQAQQVVFEILTHEHAPLLRNPDDLALVLVALMLVAMAAGFMLWRAIVRERQVQSPSP